jgi:hypothetical protein
MYMKYLIALSIFLGLSVLCSAQTGLPSDPETNKISWQETIPLDSITRDEMFDRCKRWLAHYYKIESFSIDSKVSYTIAAAPDFSISLTYDFKYKSKNDINYTITLNQKEGKYRVTITDFKFYKVSSGKNTQIPLEQAYAKMTSQNKGETTTQVKAEIEKVLEDLKVFMVKGYVKTQDDW